MEEQNLKLEYFGSFNNKNNRLIFSSKGCLYVLLEVWHQRLAIIGDTRIIFSQRHLNDNSNIQRVNS